MTYTVSLTNNDGSNCGALTFNLPLSMPYGWTATIGSSALTLSPGAIGSTSPTVTSPASTPNEIEPIGVPATNSADIVYTASAWVNYVIGTSLSVTVTINQTSYTRNQSVVVTTAVSAQGSPVANTGVNFPLTESNGASEWKFDYELKWRRIVYHEAQSQESYWNVYRPGPCNERRSLGKRYDQFPGAMASRPLG